MRNPLSQTIVNIKPSGIRKFFDIVSEMKDAISLGVGEPDFDTPWHVRDEGIYSLEKGRMGGSNVAGDMVSIQMGMAMGQQMVQQMQGNQNVQGASFAGAKFC